MAALPSVDLTRVQLSALQRLLLAIPFPFLLIGHQRIGGCAGRLGAGEQRHSHKRGYLLIPWHSRRCRLAIEVGPRTAGSRARGGRTRG